MCFVSAGQVAVMPCPAPVKSIGCNNTFAQKGSLRCMFKQMSKCAHLLSQVLCCVQANLPCCVTKPASAESLLQHPDPALIDTAASNCYITFDHVVTPTHGQLHAHLRQDSRTDCAASTPRTHLRHHGFVDELYARFSEDPASVESNLAMLAGPSTVLCHRASL